MVYRDLKNFNILRVGPLIIYISESTVKFFKERFVIPSNIVRKAYVEVRYAKRLILEALEITMLAEAVQSINNSIVLLDGSLRQPSIELRDYPFKKIVRHVLNSESSLIGVSKSCLLYTSPSPRD